MPLLGRAAMLLNFDIEPSAIAEHDHWHTHEHLPERLSIPGFRRGTRWVAVSGAPRYTVLYEVDRLETLGSAAYLARLNDPTPWTRKMMPHYRGMSRGLCTVNGSWGHGLGHFALLLRFASTAETRAGVHAALAKRLPDLPSRPGLGSAHWLTGALAAAMTSEQRIRGADAGVDSALLVTGYELEAVEALQAGELSAAALQAHGAIDLVSGIYRSAYTLTADEARPPTP